MIKVEFETYSQWCGQFHYGSKFLELPEAAIEALDDYMDGAEFTNVDERNPDNLYVNHYYYIPYYNGIEDKYVILHREGDMVHALK